MKEMKCYTSEKRRKILS